MKEGFLSYLILLPPFFYPYTFYEIQRLKSFSLTTKDDRFFVDPLIKSIRWIDWIVNPATHLTSNLSRS